MGSHNVPPPPASSDPHDGRNARHGCGFAYNKYRWGSCPSCEADERNQYAMVCLDCRESFFATERVDPCPECGSGETRVIAEPEVPAVR